MLRICDARMWHMHFAQRVSYSVMSRIYSLLYALICQISSRSGMISEYQRMRYAPSSRLSSSCVSVDMKLIGGRARSYARRKKSPKIHSNMDISPLLAYILTINILAYTLMWVDKVKSIYGWWRISERTLWILALIGGA